MSNVTVNGKPHAIPAETTLASLKEYSAANTARLRVMLKPSRHGRRDLARVRERLQPLLDARQGAVFVFREEGVGLREILASGEAAFSLGIVAEKGEDALRLAAEGKYNLKVELIENYKSLLHFLRTLKNEEAVILIENRVPEIIKKELLK